MNKENAKRLAVIYGTWMAEQQSSIVKSVWGQKLLDIQDELNVYIVPPALIRCTIHKERLKTEARAAQKAMRSLQRKNERKQNRERKNG